MGASILILGATSAIARASAHEFARRQNNLVLAGRDRHKLEAIAADLSVRYGVTCRVWEFDALRCETHALGLEEVLSQTPLAGVLLAFGALGEELGLRQDAASLRELVTVNLIAAMTVLNPLADYFEARKSGFISVIGSVAGDRGRQSNYLYGATKAGLATYVAGLRHRLAATGVRVLLVKPGFVDTPMTYGRPGMFWVAKPEWVGKVIAQACERDDGVIYVPWFWRWIMALVCALPDPVFHRTKL